MTAVAIGGAVLVGLMVGVAWIDAWRRERRDGRRYAAAVRQARLVRVDDPRVRSLQDAGARVTFRPGGAGPYDEEKALAGRARALARDSHRRTLEAGRRRHVVHLREARRG